MEQNLITASQISLNYPTVLCFVFLNLDTNLSTVRDDVLDHNCITVGHHPSMLASHPDYDLRGKWLPCELVEGEYNYWLRTVCLASGKDMRRAIVS